MVGFCRGHRRNAEVFLVRCGAAAVERNGLWMKNESGARRDGPRMDRFIG